MSGLPHAWMILFTFVPGWASCPSGRRMIADEASVFSESTNRTIAVIVLFITCILAMRTSLFISGTNVPLSSELLGIRSRF